MGESLKVGIGIVGVGVISGQYFTSLTRLDNISLIAVADLDLEQAKQVAAEQGCAALTVEEMMSDPRIEMILNLTTPQAHAEILRRAVASGKHVFTEKPLALSTAEISDVLQAARAAKIAVGCAPDTVLGTGIQTARDAIDKKLIGEVIGASAFWSAPGHELWHPAPAFYYQPGAGPLFDMGPYYLTALVTLLGPVEAVSGSATRSNRARTIATGPQASAEIEVDVDTHINAILFHASGISSTVTMSFEIWSASAPLIEVFGTKGTLAVPDPNQFSEAVKIKLPGESQWTVLEPTAGYISASRGYGLAEMAESIAHNRTPRTCGDLGFHVLEIMESILTAASTRTVVKINSTVARMQMVELSEVVS